jgi:hypothetical protein
LEIVDIVCNDEFSRCGNGEFEDKIVVRVRQEWPPSIKNLLVIRQFAQTVHNLAEFISREMRNEARPQKDRFILKNEGDGHGDSDIPGADRLENLKAGTPIRSESRHKD